MYRISVNAQFSPILILVMALGGWLAIFQYYQTFAVCLDENCPGFTVPYNFIDHLVYNDAMNALHEGELVSVIVSNYGVSILYNFALLFLPEGARDRIVEVSLIFNSICYFAIIALAFKISHEIGCVDKRVASLVILPPFFFLGAFINKEILVVMLLLALFLSFRNKKFFQFILVALLLCLIRIQYIAMILMFIMLCRGRFWLNFCLLYLVTSLMTAYIASNSVLFQLDYGTGLTQLVSEINRKYLLGSLMLNPVRFVHYILSQGQSFWFILDDEGTINLMKLFEFLTFVWLLAIVPGIYRFALIFREGCDQRDLILLRGLIVSYVLVLLMTPITEPRYLWPILPVLLLASSFRGRGRLVCVPKTVFLN